MKSVPLCCSLVLAAAVVAAADAPLSSLPPAARSGGATQSGGDTTVTDASRHAYGRSLANLRRERWSLLRSGKELFAGFHAAMLVAAGVSALAGVVALTMLGGVKMKKG